MPANTTLEVNLELNTKNREHMVKFLEVLDIASQACVKSASNSRLQPRFSVVQKTIPAKAEGDAELYEANPAGGEETSRTIAAERNRVCASASTQNRPKLSTQIDHESIARGTEESCMNTDCANLHANESTTQTNASLVFSTQYHQHRPITYLRASQHRYGLDMHSYDHNECHEGVERGLKYRDVNYGGRQSAGYWPVHHTFHQNLADDNAQRVELNNKIPQHNNKWSSIAKEPAQKLGGQEKAESFETKSAAADQQYIHDFWREKAAESRYKPEYQPGGMYHREEQKARPKSFNARPHPLFRARAFHVRTAAGGYAGGANRSRYPKSTDPARGADTHHASREPYSGLTGQGGDARSVTAPVFKTHSLDGRGGGTQSYKPGVLSSVESIIGSGQGQKLARGGALFRPIFTDAIDALTRGQEDIVRKGTD